MTDQRTHRRVSGMPKILELLREYEESPSKDLVQGYEIFRNAEAKWKDKEYALAIELYQASVDATQSCDRNREWFVEAYRNQARAYLALGDVDKKALSAAQAACSLGPKGAVNYRVLAQVHQKMGHLEAELEALEIVVATPGDDVDANDRREIGFRTARLRRELLS